MKNLFWKFLCYMKGFWTFLKGNFERGGGGGILHIIFNTRSQAPLWTATPSYWTNINFFFLFQSVGFLSWLVAIDMCCSTVFLTNPFHPHLLRPLIDIFLILLIFLHLISSASFCHPYPSPPISLHCFAPLWKYPSSIFYLYSTSTERGAGQPT